MIAFLCCFRHLFCNLRSRRGTQPALLTECVYQEAMLIHSVCIAFRKLFHASSTDRWPVLCTYGVSKLMTAISWAESLGTLHFHSDISVPIRGESPSVLRAISYGIPDLSTHHTNIQGYLRISTILIRFCNTGLTVRGSNSKHSTHHHHHNRH